MANRTPLVLGADGRPQQLQATDSIVGVVGGGPANTATATGAGPTLGTTEATVGTVTLTPTSATAKIQLVGRLDLTKDSGTTARTATARIRRGSTNTDTQVGADSIVKSQGTSVSPYGPAVIAYLDSPGTTAAVTYTLRALVDAATASTTPRYELLAFELSALGPAGPAGPSGSGGGVWSAVTTVAITVATTLTASAAGKAHVCSGPADFTLTLPVASTCSGSVLEVVVAPTFTHLLTLAAQGTDTLDGAGSRILWGGETAILYSDGTAWHKLAGKSLPMMATLRNSSVGTVNNASMTQVLLDTTDLDNTGLMANLAGNAITIKRAASFIVNPLVVFSAAGSTSAAGAGSRYLCRAFRNGSELFGSEQSGVDGSYPSPFASKIVTLAAGDSMDLRGYQNTGTSQGFYGSSTTSCYLTVQEIPSW